jgi:aspartyl-tRNA(Asn)/glutamyl-tRNA(Gln) amidotransferase subunit A
MAELNKLTIREAHEGLVSKKFSSAELTDACFAEIKKKDKDLNAFITLDEEGAMKSAKEVMRKLPREKRFRCLRGCLRQ